MERGEEGLSTPVDRIALNDKQRTAGGCVRLLQRGAIAGDRLPWRWEDTDA